MAVDDGDSEEAESAELPVETSPTTRRDTIFSNSEETQVAKSDYADKPEETPSMDAALSVSEVVRSVVSIDDVSLNTEETRDPTSQNATESPAAISTDVAILSTEMRSATGLHDGVCKTEGNWADKSLEAAFRNVEATFSSAFINTEQTRPATSVDFGSQKTEATQACSSMVQPVGSITESQITEETSFGANTAEFCGYPDTDEELPFPKGWEWLLDTPRESLIRNCYSLPTTSCTASRPTSGKGLAGEPFGNSSGG